jgi:hypothetical protein
MASSPRLSQCTGRNYWPFQGLRYQLCPNEAAKSRLATRGCLVLLSDIAGDDLTEDRSLDPRSGNLRVWEKKCNGGSGFGADISGILLHHCHMLLIRADPVDGPLSWACLFDGGDLMG